jgi:hypothetical protein
VTTRYPSSNSISAEFMRVLRTTTRQARPARSTPSANHGTFRAGGPTVRHRHTHTYGYPVVTSRP